MYLNVLIPPRDHQGIDVETTLGPPSQPAIAETISVGKGIKTGLQSGLLFQEMSCLYAWRDYFLLMLVYKQFIVGTAPTIKDWNKMLQKSLI